SRVTPPRPHPHWGLPPCHPGGPDAITYRRPVTRRPRRRRPTRAGVERGGPHDRRQGRLRGGPHDRRQGRLRRPRRRPTRAGVERGGPHDRRQGRLRRPLSEASRGFQGWAAESHELAKTVAYADGKVAELAVRVPAFPSPVPDTVPAEPEGYSAKAQ